jgi:F-type H+-transporting ATPase subunit epsilon
MPDLTCTVVTPERTAIDQQADFVALPLYDGEIGIATHRSPMIGRLGFGELRLRVGAEVTRYYLDGGFVQVANNVVSVLTNRAIPAAEIDTEAAGEKLKQALRQPVSTPELLAARDRAIAQARAQLHVARRARS